MAGERYAEKLARQQLDRRLDALRDKIHLLQVPRDGWVSSLRHALAMTQENLAKRMGVSRQAIGQLEQREMDGSATLKALEQAAQALGGKLVYAIVPRTSINRTLEERALEIASRITGSARHTMRLEDQEPDSDLHHRTLELAKQLLDSPEELWVDQIGD